MPGKLGDALRKEAKGRKLVKSQSRKDPLWKGPQDDGITQSMLSRFLVCRERFRLYVVEGLVTDEKFNHRLGYGDFWHICEEAIAEYPGDDNYWQEKLKEHCRGLITQHRTEQYSIEKWYQVCKAQFPVYLRWLDYQRSHSDVLSYKNLMQEETFRIPYKLPSGRVVYLRGKWDGVIQRMGIKGNWLHEHKTKGNPDRHGIQTQLTYDLQTNFYLVALTRFQKFLKDPQVDSYGISPDLDYYRKTKELSSPIHGVFYNVIRRPLSGGKGSIVQKKGSKNVPSETKVEYYARLKQYMIDDPDHFFMVWDAHVSPSEIRLLEERFLQPALEQLCDWWDWLGHYDYNPWKHHEDNCRSGGLHWIHPYGVYNLLNEGGRSDVDNYIHTGNMTGLTRTDSLFKELA